MSDRWGWWLTATILLTSGLEAAEPLQLNPEIVAFGEQDHTLTLAVSSALPEPLHGLVDCVTFPALPASGAEVTCADQQIRYKPLASFFGRDVVHYEANYGTETLLGTLVIYVTPRIIPLAGRWDDSGPPREALGFYDIYTRWFYLCGADRATMACGSGELKCPRYRFGSAGTGWLPILGDWDRQDDDDDRVKPGLYDRQTRTLFLLNYPDGTDYCKDCEEDLTLNQLIHLQVGELGDVPVVGDWDGDGQDALALYRPADNAFYLYEFIDDGAGIITGVEPPQPLSGFSLSGLSLWPFVIWRAGQDHLGLYDPVAGLYEMRAAQPGAPVLSGYLEPGISSIVTAGRWESTAPGDDAFGVYDRSTHFLQLDVPLMREDPICPDGGPLVTTFPEDPDA